MGTYNPDLIRSVGIFAGGIAGSGYICGAVLGGMTLISSQYSRGTADEKEDPRMFKVGHMLDVAFEEITREFGGKECSKIAQVDWMDRDQVTAYSESPDSRRKYCREIVGETARALGEIIEKEMS